MALPQIVSQLEILRYLGKVNPTDDELEIIGILHPMVERAVRSEIQSGVTQDTYTHYLPGAEGTPPERRISTKYTPPKPNILTLPEFPVRSITSVHEDSSAYANSGSSPWGSETELTEGTDFYVDYDQSGLSMSGMLITLGSGWCTTPRSIKVVYTAGWSEAEIAGQSTDYNLDASDIRVATLITFKSYYESTQFSASGTIKREKLADYEIEYFEDSSKTQGRAITLPPLAKGLLSRFYRANTMIY